MAIKLLWYSKKYWLVHDRGLTDNGLENNPYIRRGFSWCIPCKPTTKQGFRALIRILTWKPTKHPPPIRSSTLESDILFSPEPSRLVGSDVIMIFWRICFDDKLGRLPPLSMWLIKGVTSAIYNDIDLYGTY